VFNGKGALDTLQHSHDVLALALRPDGKQLAVSTLDGSMTLWDPQEGQMQVWQAPTPVSTLSVLHA
jgi:periodic tryptophan protein 2